MDGKVINENERHAMVGVRSQILQAFSTVGGFKQTGPIADSLFKGYKNSVGGSPLGAAYSSNAGKPSRLVPRQSNILPRTIGNRTAVQIGSNSSCFVAGTLVDTKLGFQVIDKINLAKPITLADLAK